MKKIPPSKRISKTVAELLEQGTGGCVIREFLRLGKQILIQELLEAEVKDFLGRDLRGPKTISRVTETGMNPGNSRT